MQNLSPITAATIQNYVEETTQGERGDDINTLITDISRTQFQTLAEDLKKDKADQAHFQKVKKWFVIGSICFAVVAVIVAIVSMILSAGIFSAGVVTVALMSGSVGISASFGQLDKAIARLIEFSLEENQKNLRIPSLSGKIDVIRGLLNDRIEGLGDIEKKNVNSRIGEIFNQIKLLNTYIKQIKRQVPSEINLFPLFNASPLTAQVVVTN